MYWSKNSSNNMLGADPTQTDGLIPPEEPAANTSTNGTASPGATVNIGVQAGGDVAVVKEFNVTNQGFTFNPKNISVKKGDKVKITFKNGGGTHDFRIEVYNIGTEVLQNGMSQSIEFTADKEGTFEFYCSVGNHRAMGMKGTFTVTP